MFFFAYGVDPLITYLERSLTGILIFSLPVYGPVLKESKLKTLPPVEECYHVVSYADDIKPAITSMGEFMLVNNASALFEATSGCCLHRDPISQKCKFLPLGRWRNTLQQEDLPAACQYMVISDHLDMLGVQLRATWTQTRKSNGDIIQQRVSNTINSWKAGKFMPLTMRPWSVNSFVLAKVWFRCGSVDLRVGDINAINSSIKSWLYADLLEKPSELVMCRPASYGGLVSLVSSLRPWLLSSKHSLRPLQIQSSEEVCCILPCTDTMFCPIPVSQTQGTCHAIRHPSLTPSDVYTWILL